MNWFRKIKYRIWGIRYGRPRIHPKLRKAIKQMELIYHPSEITHLSDGVIFKEAYHFEMKKGVKITKWHRLVRMKVRDELRGQQELVCKRVIDQMLDIAGHAEPFPKHILVKP